MLDLKNYKEVNLQTYQCLIKKLIYLVCGTRPDIAFVVEQLSRHNANLRKNHYYIAKKVVRYLKKIIEMGLTFGQESTKWPPRDSSFYGLVNYVDSNFAKDWEH